MPLDVMATDGCHISEKAVQREEERENGPRLLCPVLPAQNAPAPQTAATEEEKNRFKIIEEDHEIQESMPPLSPPENEFDWNNEIFPRDIYGALRQVSLCHSRNEVLKIFDSSLGSWTLGYSPLKFFKKNRFSITCAWRGQELGGWGWGGCV